MTDLEEELTQMVQRLRSGRGCWCIAWDNPKQDHTPNCRDAQKLMGRVRYGKVDDARHGRTG